MQTNLESSFFEVPKPRQKVSTTCSYALFCLSTLLTISSFVMLFVYYTNMNSSLLTLHQNYHSLHEEFVKYNQTSFNSTLMRQLESNYTSMTSSVASMNIQLSNLQNTVGASSSSNISLVESINTLNEQITGFQGHLTNIINQIAGFSSGINQINSTLYSWIASQSLNVSNQSFSSINSTINQLSEAINSLNSTLVNDVIISQQNLSDTLASLNQNYEAMNSSLTQFETNSVLNFTSVSNKFNLISSQLDSYDKNFKIINMNLNTQGGVLDIVEQNVTNLGEYVNNLNAEFKTLDQEYQDLSKNFTTQDKNLTEIRQNITTLISELEGVQNQFVSLSSPIQLNMNLSTSQVNSSSETIVILGWAEYPTMYNNSYAICQTLYNPQGWSPTVEGYTVELFYSTENNEIQYSQVYNESIRDIVPFVGAFKLNGNCESIQFGAIITNGGENQDYSIDSFPVSCVVFGYNII